MNKYRVMLEGKNCFIRDNQTNQIRRVGFFTSRNVEADNEETARKMAVKFIIDELYAGNVLENTESDPPAILVEQIFYVDSFDLKTPMKGFTFYLDDIMDH